ncbi:hypothetical protein SNEBB_002245, partial [Seison nebaliae]
FLFNGKS